jgi:hypothetical protein
VLTLSPSASRQWLKQTRLDWDRRVATRWPALHVTRTHLVISVMLLVYPLVALFLYQIASIDSPPKPDVTFWIMFIISAAISIAWLIHRGIQYRLLPVARRLGRAHWIWLDLISLIIINLGPVVGVTVLEWRLRSLISIGELDRHASTLRGAEPQPPGLWYYSGVREFQSRWVEETKQHTQSTYGLSRTVDLAYKLSSDEPLNLLLRYVPAKDLKASGLWVDVSGVEQAFVNMNTFKEAHNGMTLTDAGKLNALSLTLAVIVGLELWVAGLAALTGAGLLGGLALFGFYLIVFAIASVADLSNEYLVWILSLPCLAVLAATIGLVRQRSTFVTKVTLAFSVLVIPIAGWLATMVTWDRMNGSSQELAVLCIMGLVAVVSPCCQYCFNRLHAAPD